MIAKVTDWRIRVYNDDDSLNCSWTLKQRTAQSAEKETMHEVEQQFNGLDWSITDEALWDDDNG